MTPVECFLALVFGHFVADYPLQGEYLALSKSRHHPMGANGNWIHSLTAHAFIQGGMVALITGNIVLGIFEIIAHWLIDFFKCEKKYGLHTDQFLHILCKVVWCLIWVALK